MIYRLIASIVLVAFTFGAVQAQNVSNIYVFDMVQLKDRVNDKFVFNNPRYVTEFNKDGYNNQPRFFNDSDLYITCQYPYNDQTDIYLLDFRAKKKYQVTETLEPEYSPTLMPDGYNFSAVRTEDNGVQRLWQFPVDRLSDGKPILKYETKVGYHHWINSRRLALFLVGNPNTLVVVNVTTDRTEEVATDIGRCFQTNPTNGKLSFIHKINDRTWYIKELDPYSSSREAVTVATTLPNSEDFIVTRDGTYIMGRGSKLYKYHPQKDGDKGWREIADFRTYNINNIRRLAISNDDKIAIVTEGEALGRF